jgi:hypothetical protein
VGVRTIEREEGACVRARERERASEREREREEERVGHGATIIGINPEHGPI